MGTHVEEVPLLHVEASQGDGMITTTDVTTSHAPSHLVSLLLPAVAHVATTTVAWEGIEGSNPLVMGVAVTPIGLAVTVVTQVIRGVDKTTLERVTPSLVSNLNTTYCTFNSYIWRFASSYLSCMLNDLWHFHFITFHFQHVLCFVVHITCLFQ